MDPLTIRVPLKKNAGRGGSGAFLGLAEDGNRWWIKPKNNRQGGKVIVTEYLVGRLGALIDAPVCEVRIALITEDLRGWEFVDAVGLEPGLCHASRAIDPSVEIRALQHTDEDDNNRRHSGIAALYDWCWGGDDQWLYATTEDNKTFSHDHGWYLPDTGKNWDESSVVAQVSTPHTYAALPQDLAPQYLQYFADRVESVTRAELVEVMKSVPASYPVTDADLEALGFFLEARAPGVAERLRKLAGGSS